mgnify:FL=1
MRLLFGALGAGLIVVAVAAWDGGLRIAAVGAGAIAAWLVTLALGGLRRR